MTDISTPPVFQSMLAADDRAPGAQQRPPAPAAALDLRDAGDMVDLADVIRRDPAQADRLRRRLRESLVAAPGQNAARTIPPTHETE